MLHCWDFFYSRPTAHRTMRFFACFLVLELGQILGAKELLPIYPNKNLKCGYRIASMKAHCMPLRGGEIQGVDPDPGFAVATSDVGFKKLMDVSDCDEIVISFLNTLIPSFDGQRVTSVTAADVVLPAIPRHIGEKISFMDFHVVSNTGVKYIVGMQAIRHIRFDERAIYYLCNTMGRQTIEEVQGLDRSSCLKRTVAIQVLDYDTPHIQAIDPKGEVVDSLLASIEDSPMKPGQHIKHYIFTDSESEEQIDTIQLVQIELPRYPKSLFPPSDDFDLADWWMSVLRHSKHYTSEMIERSRTMPDVIKKALDRLHISKWNPEVRKGYQYQNFDRKLYQDVLDVERAEGKLEARMAMTKSLVIEGVPDATILRAGVTEEELKMAKDAVKLSLGSS
jgi:predicted transposase/invertase (TIGR01784 family)